MHLTDLRKAAKSSGLKVRTIPGWKTRGRPRYTGAFNPKGVGCHHTGGSSNSAGYVRWMALTGRSDLPAPLCQLALDRQGTVYVCAAGRANHAGVSNGVGFTYAGDGNAQMVGIEAMNTGSEGWSETQYDAYVRLCAALCDHYGWPRSHVLGHKEWSTTGKWDPGGISMGRFRRDVRQVGSISQHMIGGFDMASDEDVQQLRRIVRQESRKAARREIKRASTREARRTASHVWNYRVARPANDNRKKYTHRRAKKMLQLAFKNSLGSYRQSRQGRILSRRTLNRMDGGGGE